MTAVAAVSNTMTVMKTAIKTDMILL